MNYIITLGLVFLLFGCSLKQKYNEVSMESSTIVLNDLISIPQNISAYTSSMEDKKYNIDNNYTNAYFSVWNIKIPIESLENIKWPFRSFTIASSYGENLLPLKQSFFDTMYEKSNFESYLKESKNGITLDYTHMRALPTSKPLLSNPSLAGEGFPFDYLQNSSINANVPVFISHYSNDKQWAFVFSRFTYGWIKSKDVVVVDEKHVTSWKEAKQVHIIREGIALYTDTNEALFSTRIGMMLPLIEENTTHYIVQTVSKYKNSQAMYNRTKISKEFARVNTLPLSQDNLNIIINEVSKTNYGWGGVYGQRDCSSTLMDLYAPFGIALPRNSSQQGKIGLVIDLSTLSNEAKINMIKQKAIAFETLLYKKGHIVLYVGTYQGKVVVFHNTWGIKTKDSGKEGRFLIGKPIFSTLTIGSDLENYDEGAELLRNIQSMNIVTQ